MKKNTIGFRMKKYSPASQQASEKIDYERLKRVKFTLIKKMSIMFI